MKLSKTAFGVLCARYRAVLIRCLLASAVVFPSIANAYDIKDNTTLSDSNTVVTDGVIIFTDNNLTLDGKGYTLANDENMGQLEIKKSNADFTSTLKDITIKVRDEISAQSLNILGNVYFDAGTSVSLSGITGSDDGLSKIHADTGALNLNGNKYKNISMDAGKSKINFGWVGSVNLDNVSMTASEVSNSNSTELFFFGKNTITADKFTIKSTQMTVEEGATVTLNSKAGADISALHLHGDFYGDLSVGTLYLYDNGRFFGKIVEKNNSGRVTVAGTNVDMAQLKLSEGSNIKTLEVSDQLKDANITLNSDFTANTFHVLSFTTGTISGTGTLKIEKAVIADKSTFTFKNIKIAANGNDLSVEHAGNQSGDSFFTFDNVALSAPGTITLSNENTVFKGNSSLTAKNITVADNITISGTLTVDGVLDAGNHSLTGGTLNVVLPENPSPSSTIITAKADSVTLTLDLKNVKNKDAAKEYKITDTKTGYTLSGKYGRYAFSASDFTLDEYRKKKDAFTLTQAWDDASNGTLWIMKVAGGAEAAISDLRDAGVFVSPTEENASKILDMVDNPYADRLIDLLDSGDLGLQKQALRETVPTDAAQSSFKTARETALSVMNTVAGRMGNASAVSGRSGGDLTVGRSSVWAQGMVNRAKMTGGDGFKSDTAGCAAGVETNLTDEIKAGFGYAFASTDIKTDRSKTDADTHTGFVYGEYAPGKLYVNAVAGFGRSDYDDTTRIAGMKSSFGADTYSARVAAGYDAGMLTPEAALRFVSVRQKVYTDALGARVSAKNLNTTTAVAGAKAGREFFVGKYGVSPELRLAATYDLQRPNEGRAVTLPDGSSYVAAGEHLKRLGAEIGAKAAARLTNDVEVSLTYDGAFKEHYQNHTGLVNVSVGF